MRCVGCESADYPYYPETGLFEAKYDNWTVAKLAYYDALWCEARESYLARYAPELSTICP
jgi:hypothetical protein